MNARLFGAALAAFYVLAFLQACWRLHDLVSALTLISASDPHQSIWAGGVLAMMQLVAGIMLLSPLTRTRGLGLSIIVQCLYGYLSLTRFGGHEASWPLATGYLFASPQVACALALALTLASLFYFIKSDESPAAGSENDRTATVIWDGSLAALGLGMLIIRYKGNEAIWIEADNGLIPSGQFRLLEERRRQIGEGSRPLLLVFSDYECPACRQSDRKLDEAIRAGTVSVSDVAFINFPLTSIHPFAYRAAIIAEGVPKERFWTMHDRLMKAELSTARLDAFQKELQGPPGGATRKGRVVVDRDQALAKTLGLFQTPTLFAVTDRYGVRFSSIDEALRWMSSGS